MHHGSKLKRNSYGECMLTPAGSNYAGHADESMQGVLLFAS